MPVDGEPRLTRREQDVLAALCQPRLEGEIFTEPASVRQIAEALVVTEAAVKQHLGHLYEKFAIPPGDGRRARLANEAIRRGAVSMPGHDPADSLAPDADLLQAGRDAFARRDWERTYQLLAAADRRTDLAADDLERLGEAALWSNHHPESVAARQRAYAKHLEAGDVRRAALVALSLVINHAARLEPAVAGGWYGKAERLLESEPEGPEHGHLAITRALIQQVSGDIDGALESSKQAEQIGSRFGDEEIQALVLTFQGFSLARQGRLADGMPLLDEAMVSAVAGGLSPLATGIIYCRTICACLDHLDYHRAAEWTEAVERGAETTGMIGFPGDCRTHHVAILFAKGDWDEAEAQAKRACDECATFDLAHSALASYELGELYLRRGDFEAAESAFQRAHELGHVPQPGLALLRLAQGDEQAASQMLAEPIAGTPPGSFERVRLLSAQVEIALACGEVETAAPAGAELEQIADQSQSPALQAAADCAQGALALASGDESEAISLLRRGSRLWLEADAPYELAAARVRLAEALLTRGDTEAATLEFAAAQSTFERLGAAPDSAYVQARRAELGRSR